MRENPVENAAYNKTRKYAQIRTSKQVRQGTLQQGRVQPERGGDHIVDHREQASRIDATLVPVWSPNANKQANRVIRIPAQPDIGEIDDTPGNEKENHQRQELAVQRVEIGVENSNGCQHSADHHVNERCLPTLYI